jgi:hypothetical protein
MPLSPRGCADERAAKAFAEGIAEVDGSTPLAFVRARICR